MKNKALNEQDQIEGLVGKTTLSRGGFALRK